MSATYVMREYAMPMLFEIWFRLDEIEKERISISHRLPHNKLNIKMDFRFCCSLIEHEKYYSYENFMKIIRLEIS